MEYLRSDVKVSLLEKFGKTVREALSSQDIFETENKVQLKDFHKLIIFVSVPIGLCSNKSISEMFHNKTVLFALSSFNFMGANALLLLIAMQFDIMNNK